MSKTSSAGKIAGGVLGLAAGAAAAAASYYFYGKDSKTHRKNLSVWGKKAKAEMLAKIKKMKAVSKTTYDQAAKEVLAKYKQAKNIKPQELETLGRELKGHWDKISRDLSKLGAKKSARVKK